MRISRIASLLETDLSHAHVGHCLVYGISVWNVKLEGTFQFNLLVMPNGSGAVQVDNLEIAQFIHLLLDNKRTRSVIDSVATKLVLILGRFNRLAEAWPS